VIVDDCEYIRIRRDTRGRPQTSFFFASARALASAFASFFAVSFSNNACPSRLSVPILACSASGRSRSDLNYPSVNREYHLPSSIGCRGQTARLSATPCTWKTEDRTRSIRAGRYILTVFSGFCRHVVWVGLTLAIKDVNRWDRLGSISRRLFWYRYDRGWWRWLTPFLVGCHRERDRRIENKGHGLISPIPRPGVRSGSPSVKQRSKVMGGVRCCEVPFTQKLSNCHPLAGCARQVLRGRYYTPLRVGGITSRIVVHSVPLMEPHFDGTLTYEHNHTPCRNPRMKVSCILHCGGCRKNRCE